MREISRGQRKFVSGEALKLLVLASEPQEDQAGGGSLESPVMLANEALQDSQGCEAFRECQENPVLLVPRALQEKEASKVLLVRLALQDVYKGQINTTCWEFKESPDLQDSQGHQARRECRGNRVLLVPQALQDFQDLLVCLDRKVSREIAVTLVVQVIPDLLVCPGREASREAVVLMDSQDSQGYKAHRECPGNPVLLVPRAVQEQLAFLDLRAVTASISLATD